MTQQSLLLRLPAEIRLKIWQACWTVKIRPIPITFSNHQPQDSSDSAASASSQVLAILLLCKICRFIRSEAYEEFFHHTQLLLGCKAPFWRSIGPLLHPVASRRNEPVMKFILGFEFLKENIRHVSLHWAHFDNKYLPDCLEWLAFAPSLSTLEIVFSDPGFRSAKPWNWEKWERDGPFVEEFFDELGQLKWVTDGPEGFAEKRGGRPFKMGLDKIKYKLEFGRAAHIRAWKRSERFREIREELERRHLKGAGERLDPKPCYAIENYIGPYELPQGASTHV